MNAPSTSPGRRLVRFVPTLALALVLSATIAAGLLLVAPPPALQAQSGVVYVDADATGAADGTSWTDAYTTVQDALAYAAPLVPTNTVEIWVAEGVYYPDKGAGQTDDDRTSTFQLLDDVTLYGGFAATETVRTARDPATNLTVLSGDIDGNDTTDSTGVVTHTANITGTNAYHVVTGSGTDATAVLDGFTITAGNANGDFASPCAHACGGGMRNINGSPTLTNVTFSGNRASGTGVSGNGAGGGLYNRGGSPALTDVTFSGNRAVGGGGMTNQGGSNPTLTDATFSGNRATVGAGGGMLSYAGSNPVLTNVIFSGNRAGTRGGGMGNVTFSSPTLTNVTFSGNRASEGGGMFNSSSSNPTIQNSIFWNNQDSSGTGTANASISNDSSSLSIEYSLVQGWNPSGTGSLDGTDPDNAPLFVTPVDPAAAPTTAGTLRLRAGSPAIDAGDNSLVNASTDLAGAPRLVDGDGDNTATVDLGAFEFQCSTGTVLFVDTDATGAGDGTSWVDAFPTLQAALATANACPAVAELWVAEGIYYPDEGAGQTNDDPTGSFQLMDNVALYGGFAATETVRTERDWQVNLTVLSGDIDENDSTDATGVVTDTTNLTGTNAYHVVTGSGVTTTAMLDGFTITAGHEKADAIWSTPCTQACGGGMFNVNSSPTLANVTFSGNRAFYGGGMANMDNSSPFLTNVTFSGNHAAVMGGGMYNRSNSNPVLTGVTFSSNSIGNGPVASPHSGGGMLNYESNPTLTNVTFSGNSALYSGGGMYNIRSSPMLANVIFSGNSAVLGGGMHNMESSGLTLTNVSFSGNWADDVGGMSNYSSTLTIQNSVFWNNQDSGGINANAQISNTVGSAPVIGHSLVQDSSGSGSGWDSSLGVDAGGNIDADPLFVMPVDANAAPTTAGDLRLRAGSPAIDAGDDEAVPAGVTTDLDGNPRFIDGDGDGTATVDMGAYETLPSDLGITKVVTPTTALPGQPITYTLAYSNAGDGWATGVVITDVVPVEVSGATYQVSGAVVTPTGSVSYTWQVADLAPGAGGAITITGTISEALTAETTIGNTATITSAAADADLTDNSATVTTTVTPPRVQFDGAAYGVGEAEGAAVVTVTLDTANPYADATVDVATVDGTAMAGADYTAVSETLTFPAGTTVVTTSVPILDDDIDEADETVQLELRAPAGAVLDSPDTATLTIGDDDGAGVIVTPTSGLTTTEAGGSDSFTVTLQSQPTGPVTMTLSSSDTTEGTVSPAVLVFDAGTWDTPQSATVTGVDDAVADGDEAYTLQTTVDSDDPDYDGIAVADVGVTNLDDDGAGVVVVPTDMNVSEAGLTDTYTISLQSRPTDTVTITVSSDAQTTVTPAQLTFDATNWDRAKPVAVVAVDDEVVEGAHAGTITHTVVSSDPAYAGIAVSDVTASITDNDEAERSIYLPLVLNRQPPGLPDLIVDELTVADDGVTVVIANVGDEPALDPFWVDVYLDPEPAPIEVNQTWPMLADEGLVWGVTADALPLEPGETLTLTVGDTYYDSDLSEFGGTIAAGTPVYAQVDSANTETDYGGFLETHEDEGGAYNNVSGPVYPGTPVTVEPSATTAEDEDGHGAGLPPRPR